MNRRRAIVGIGVLVALLAAGAILAATLTQAPRRTETGVVIKVQGTSLTNVTGFTLRTPDGRQIDFLVGQLENGVAFPPGHLGEHVATAVPIVVTYRDESGGRVAVRLEDAAAAPTPPTIPTSPPTPT